MDAAESVEYATELANTARGFALASLVAGRLHRPVRVSTPAAGVEWSSAVPAGMVWELVSVRYTFATSAVVANRFPGLVFAVDGTTIGTLGAQAAQAASLTSLYSYFAGLGFNSAGSGANGINASLPALWLPPGATVGSSTTALDAGDAYTAITMYVREWSVGQLYWMADLVARDLSFEARHERGA